MRFFASIALGGLLVGSTALAEEAEKAVETEGTLEDAVLKRFSGSQIFVQTSANLNTFAADLQQTQNTTVDMSFTFLPRFDLGEGFQLRGRIGFDYEFTDSDFTTRRNETLLTDTTLSLFYRGLPAMPWGTRVQMAVQARLPTSKISQARTILLQPGALVQAFHSFSDVLGGSVLLMGTVGYTRPIYDSTTPQISEELPYDPNCRGAGDLGCSRQGSGALNVRDDFNWSALLLGSWGDFTPAVLYRMSHQFPYQVAELPGVDNDPVQGNDVRVFSTFAFWLDYNITNYLTAELGYVMSRNVLDGDGSYGNPIFSRYQDMRVYLGFNIGLDRFYRVLAGNTGGASGVIRN